MKDIESYDPNGFVWQSLPLQGEVNVSLDDNLGPDQEVGQNRGVKLGDIQFYNDEDDEFAQVGFEISNAGIGG